LIFKFRAKLEKSGNFVGFKGIYNFK